MNAKIRAVMALAVSVLVITILAGMPLSAQAASGQDYEVIGTDELVSLHSSDIWDFFIIDARDPGEYEEVHIKGAINVPQKKFDEYANILPGDRSVKLIFYCNGVKCGKSKKAAKQALGMGYTNVLVYAQGMPVWEEHGLPIYKGPAYEARIQTTIVSPAELKALLDSGSEGFTIVDVRDKEEFAEGHIPASMNIPVASFASDSGVLDKDSRIIVYCNSGGRSYQAYRKLMKLGYRDISQAIFADWKEAGYPVDKRL